MTKKDQMFNVKHEKRMTAAFADEQPKLLKNVHSVLEHGGLWSPPKGEKEDELEMLENESPRTYFPPGGYKSTVNPGTIFDW